MSLEYEPASEPLHISAVPARGPALGALDGAPLPGAGHLAGRASHHQVRRRWYTPLEAGTGILINHTSDCVKLLIDCLLRQGFMV